MTRTVSRDFSSRWAMAGPSPGMKMWSSGPEPIVSSPLDGSWIDRPSSICSSSLSGMNLSLEVMWGKSVGLP